MSVRQADLQTAALETTWGIISIEAGSRGIVACHLPKAPSRPVPFRIQSERLPRQANPAIRKAVAFARAMLEGRNPGHCPAPDPSFTQGSSAFRCAVWNAMRRIPRGQTATYAELAGHADAPNAARAVGGACGANPIPLFIPCHRVVGANGNLGGFSSGMEWKVLLLKGEGVSL